MKKILLLGGIGHGKTTFAKKLSKVTKIPCFELDNVAFIDRKYYVKEPPKKRDNKLKKLLSEKKWIIEGAYSAKWTYPIFKDADKVIIININKLKAQKRVLTRYIGRRKVESFKDMFYLLKHSWRYPKEYFIKQKEICKKFKIKPLILENQKQINEFLKN
ncbi:MAG: AAA family ATPase [archaeon]